jgi:hypothetical protein
MIAIITFLAGFYLGIIVFSLLVVARRNAGNQSLVKLPGMHHFRWTDQIMRAHRARSINHISEVWKTYFSEGRKGIVNMFRLHISY